jgi:hypothetical protein
MCAADGHEEVAVSTKKTVILRSRALARRLEGWPRALVAHPSRLAVKNGEHLRMKARYLATLTPMHYLSGSLGGTGDALLPAVAPPSIGSVMPVTQRDSSLARYSAP